MSHGSDILITPSGLNTMLAEGTAVVFDCRFSLADPGRGLASYLEGHVPEAHYLHLEHDLSSPVSEHGGRHPLPDIDEFAEKAAQAGVTFEKTVVVYDGGGGMAPRAWWLFEYLGHQDVRILDGGFPAWLAAGFTVSQEVPVPAPTAFAPRVQEHKLVTVADVEAIVAGEQEGLLIDSRAAARYRGETEPIDKVAGHIPGASNMPWEEGVDETGQFLAADAQRTRFADVLVDSRPLVVYCGSGVTACANLLALRLAGVESAQLYPGSWSDWCSYPTHPIETGEGRAK